MRNLTLAALIAALPLAAIAGPGVIQIRTGVTGSHSAERVVSSHPHHTIVAEARILTRGAHQAFLVEIGHRRDGVHPPLRMDRALSLGRVLDFEPATRLEGFCNGTGRCDGWRIGTLFLDRAAFERAADRGIAVQLLGPDGAYDIALPPALFAEAQGLATWLD